MEKNEDAWSKAEDALVAWTKTVAKHWNWPGDLSELFADADSAEPASQPPPESRRDALTVHDFAADIVDGIAALDVHCQYHCKMAAAPDVKAQFASVTELVEKYGPMNAIGTYSGRVEQLESNLLSLT